MTKILPHGYLSESSQGELSNEYQHDRVWMIFKKTLHPCALDKSSLSIGRVRNGWVNKRFAYFSATCLLDLLGKARRTSASRGGRRPP